MDGQVQNPIFSQGGASAAGVSVGAVLPTPENPAGGGVLNSDSVDAVDTGDIIISSAPDKPKLSRPLLLGIIVSVLILVGGAVAAVILLTQQKSSSSTPMVTKVNETTLVTADDYKDAFLLYANYVLTGVASTDALPESYDVNADYYIWGVYNSRNKDALDVASGYWENFKMQFDGSGLIDINSAMASYDSDFETVEETLMGEISDDATNEEINEYYSRARNAQIRVVENIWNVREALNEQEN